MMYALMMQEIDPLHRAIDFVETAKPDQLHKGMSSALDTLYRVTRQLEQYRDMVAAFEKARFETLLPQPAPAGQEVENMLQARQAADSMKQFEKFLEKAAEHREISDDSEPEEG
jgi:hypothetical protein